MRFRYGRFKPQGRVKLRSIKIIFRLAVTGALIFAAAGVWAYLHDLHTRFPEIDMERARFGIASWYSETDKNINERTANGEIFNDRKMTCASWYYPFGEKLLVINMLNGTWVVCRVNDRGPNKRLKREIDLTKAAFSRIANLRRGLTPVAVIPIRKENKRVSAG